MYGRNKMVNLTTKYKTRNIRAMVFIPELIGIFRYNSVGGNVNLVRIHITSGELAFVL
jgi:hypothetical protein